MVQPVPEGYENVIPHLIVDNGAAALDFYVAALGAVEISRAPGPDGRLMHAEMRIGDSVIFLADDYPEMNDGKANTPAAHGGTSVTLHQMVPDVDAAVAKAEAAGARVTMPPADMFWGDWYGVVVDPFGHEWAFATHVKDVTPEEMADAVAAFGGDQ